MQPEATTCPLITCYYHCILTLHQVFPSWCVITIVSWPGIQYSPHHVLLPLYPNPASSISLITCYYHCILNRDPVFPWSHVITIVSWPGIQYSPPSSVITTVSWPGIQYSPHHMLLALYPDPASSIPLITCYYHCILMASSIPLITCYYHCILTRHPVFSTSRDITTVC